MTSFARQVLEIVRKDLAIEWRTREIVYTTAFLAAVEVLICSFALGHTTERVTPGMAAGILWVVILFSGIVGLARTFDREREGQALKSILLSPVNRSALYLGKVIGISTVLVAVEVLALGLTALFFGVDVGTRLPQLVLALLLGTVGFAAVGVVFSAALLGSRGREILLSILLFPVAVPVLIAGVKLTADLLDPVTHSAAAVAFWLRFLAACDLIFLVVGLWSFEPIVVGD